MPYWNKYPTRDRAGDRGKPAANLTSRGMGVSERLAASMRANAEGARLETERLAEAGLTIRPPATEETKP